MYNFLHQQNLGHIGHTFAIFQSVFQCTQVLSDTSVPKVVYGYFKKGCRSHAIVKSGTEMNFGYSHNE